MLLNLLGTRSLDPAMCLTRLCVPGSDHIQCPGASALDAAVAGAVLNAVGGPICRCVGGFLALAAEDSTECSEDVERKAGLGETISRCSTMCRAAHGSQPLIEVDIKVESTHLGVCAGGNLMLFYSLKLLSLRGSHLLLLRFSSGDLVVC
jgi:hypothetical protein